MPPVLLANLGCFGIADNIRPRLQPKYIGDRLLGENHGAIFTGFSSKWQKMVAPHLYGSSPLLPTCGAISLPKNRHFTVISGNL